MILTQKMDIFTVQLIIFPKTPSFSFACSRVMPPHYPAQYGHPATRFSHLCDDVTKYNYYLCSCLYYRNRYMNIFKRYYSRFTRWQLKRPAYQIDESQEVTCLNCGNTYKGNFCPHCGQNRNVKRFTWHGVFTGAMDVWGLGGVSLLRNIKHLLLRPGFMIADYLHGHRQPYFPPFKTLFLLVALLLVVRSMLNMETNFVDDSTMSHIQDPQIALMIGFLNTHRVVLMLVLALLMAVFLKLFFSNTKRMGRINMCECVYTQIWVVNQMVLLQTILSLFYILLGHVYTSFVYVYLVAWIINYKQIFGLGWWSTAWRTLLLALLTFISTVILIILLGILI